MLKLALMPLIVWASGRYLFTLDPLWLTVATLNAAMPAGANVYMVAQLYRTGVGLATNVVVISTGFSIFTSLWRLIGAWPDFFLNNTINSYVYLLFNSYCISLIL